MLTPVEPSSRYAEWDGWREFLGTEALPEKYHGYTEFQKFLRCVAKSMQKGQRWRIYKAHVSYDRRIRSKDQWQSFLRARLKPYYFPEDPESVYAVEWISWDHAAGTEKLAAEEAKREQKYRLNQLSRVVVFRIFCTKFGICPTDLDFLDKADRCRMAEEWVKIWQKLPYKYRERENPKFFVEHSSEYMKEIIDAHLFGELFPEAAYKRDEHKHHLSRHGAGERKMLLRVAAKMAKRGIMPRSGVKNVYVRRVAAAVKDSIERGWNYQTDERVWRIAQWCRPGYNPRAANRPLVESHCKVLSDLANKLGLTSI